MCIMSELSKDEKKEYIKKYFFSDKLSHELIEDLKLNYNEYNLLIREVKKELGLASSYRRNPKTFGKYHKGAYMVVKDGMILGFYPTMEIAIENGDDDCDVVIASDDELLNIIEKDFDNNMSLDKLMIKYNLPYSKVLDLIKKMKNRKGMSSNQNRTNNKYHHIYRYPPNGKLTIKKFVDGKLISFGYYDNYDDALLMRDYLEKINWERNVWLANRKKILNSG